MAERSERVSNSSRRSLEDPGLNPARGVFGLFIRTNLLIKIDDSSPAILVVCLYITN